MWGEEGKEMSTLGTRVEGELGKLREHVDKVSVSYSCGGGAWGEVKR